MNGHPIHLWHKNCEELRSSFWAIETNLLSFKESAPSINWIDFKFPFLSSPFSIFLQWQRDPRLNEILFPFFNQSRVRNIIQSYETDEEFIGKGKFYELLQSLQSPHESIKHWICFKWNSKFFSNPYYHFNLQGIICKFNKKVSSMSLHVLMDMDTTLASFVQLHTLRTI